MNIIKSILDTDLYKFTTGYAYFKLFPKASGEFRFVDRGNTVYPAEFEERLREAVEEMRNLRLSEDEVNFLKRELPYIPPAYIDFLKGFRFDPGEVSISCEGGALKIKAEGLLYRITMWETPILAAVSELYYIMTGAKPDMDYVIEMARNKGVAIKENKIQTSIFGMRRRFSSMIEDIVTKELKDTAGEYLYGTSNLYFAKKYGLRVSGTHPHEWIQFHGAVYGYKMANYMAMEHWIDVYDGDLGTVLTDTYTTDVFFRNFSKKHALLFTSLRHDSGDPFVFADKAVAKYKALKVEPKTKYIVFSDGLNIERAISIKNYCDGKIGATFGIGTNFTNDAGNGIEPLNIVMKLYACRLSEDQPKYYCVKLSDVEGKHTGNEDEIKLAKATLSTVDY